MNNVFKKFSLTSLCICAAFSFLTMTSCSDDEPEESKTPNTSQSTMSTKAKEIYNKLQNTTWTLISSPYPKAPLGNTITFSSIPIFDGAYNLYCSAYPNDVFAWLPAPDHHDPCDLLMTWTLTNCNATNAGDFISLFGCSVNLSWSGNRMIMTSISDSNKKYVYTESTSGAGTGGESGYEKPDVGFYDYTQLSKSSVKVDFIIYNKDEAGVSTVSIKYGTSSATNSSASTSLVGNHAVATISGLKSDTKYYVKCTVKGKGGTVTTDAFAISLTSW